MATMGRLVAGVAHEINTPLGNAVLGTSALVDDVKVIEEKFLTQTMTKKDFKHFLDVVPPLLNVITTALSKAANLVQSFKLVSVDQQEFSLKRFNVSEKISQLANDFSSRFIEQGVVINITGKEDIIAISYPDALYQILSQLINNSLTHAFKNQENGKIFFEINLDIDSCTILYSDNGQGISKEDIHHIFDPFFTTGREQGCIGLGLHVVFNLVHQVLQGEIKCQDSLLNGTQFTIVMPINNGDS